MREICEACGALQRKGQDGIKNAKGWFCSEACSLEDLDCPICGEPLDDPAEQLLGIRKLKADIRALQAVKALDAHAAQLGLAHVPEPYVLSVTIDGGERWWHEWMPDGARSVDSPMEARIAAAEAIGK